MMPIFRSENRTYILISLGLFAAIAYFIIRIVYAGIIALPYPKELLEPANVALTNLFIEGKNPYTVESLSWGVPGVNYDYPFLNSLVAATISRITSCNAVTAHFVLSLFSIITSGVIGFFMVKDRVMTSVAPLMASLLFMFCHWRYGYISAAPDDLGLLVFLLTMNVATSERIRNKPLICSIGITLCFYTKQYFVFIAPCIFIYMLFYSRIEALKLCVWTFLINIAIAIILWNVMPLYYIKVIMFTYLGTAVGGKPEIVTLINQFKYLIILFAALFAVIMFTLVVYIRRAFCKHERLSKIFRIRENDIFSLCVISSIVMLVPLYIIGRNDGAFITYFLQLWIPSIVVVALICFERAKPKNESIVFVFAYVMIAVSTIYFSFGKLPLHILSDDEIANWDKAYKYIREYNEKGDIYYSRSLVYYGFENSKGDWQCGHEGEVRPNTIESLTDYGFQMDFFQDAESLVDQNIEYREKLLKKAEKQEYSLITFETTDGFALFDEENCEGYGYTYIDTLTLQLGNMPYDVELYSRQI